MNSFDSFRQNSAENQNSCHVLSALCPLFYEAWRTCAAAAAFPVPQRFARGMLLGMFLSLLSPARVKEMGSYAEPPPANEIWWEDDDGDWLPNFMDFYPADPANNTAFWNGADERMVFDSMEQKALAYAVGTTQNWTAAPASAWGGAWLLHSKDRNHPWAVKLFRATRPYERERGCCLRLAERKEDSARRFAVPSYLHHGIVASQTAFSSRLICR